MARTATAAPWPAEVSEAVFALDHAGSVSALVESADGFRLFRLTARKAPMPRALSEVRDQIAHRLQRQRREAATRQFQESLRAGLAIQVNPAVLAAIKPASSSLAQVAQPPALPAR